MGGKMMKSEKGIVPGHHILAGISCGWRFRRQLADIERFTTVDHSLLALDPMELKKTGIKALALDFDGVLAHHGAPVPLPEVVEWLQNCSDVFGGNRLFILSNKPTETRRSWFAKHFPEICFIAGVRKKPYPDGLNKTGELAGVPLSAILMVDDRLLTGCLAALNAGSIPCYIRKPFICFSQSTISEIFFWLLRHVERFLVRMFG
jgi:HAD superfamily phosphatase (TIGR01668 family)